MEETNTPVEMSTVSLNDFYLKLSEKVSDYNAKLLLHSVVVVSGVQRGEKEAKLNKDDAKAICLELIRKGGPGFQVGKDFYTQLQ